MKFKFTWGTGILLTIILFVSFFISFVIFSFTKDVNLVTEDYFPDEIAYDLKIEKIKNTNALKEKVNFHTKNNILKITFPSFISDRKKIKGTILLYYIKNYKNDKIFNIKPDKEKSQYINIGTFPKGRYSVKVDWSYNNKTYFQEKIIEIK